MPPAISIIIPVYNVEKWIQRAVSSLQEQTLKDFELILVDDGSTDASGGILDELAAEDARVRVVHQANAGAARARNAAIALATGEFLYFMDGDDWCEPTMLQEMHDFAVASNLDMVVTGFFIDTYYADDKFYREVRTAPDKVFASQQEFREHAHELFDAQLLYAPWNKLYKREWITSNGIVFPSTFWDDLPFNLDVIRNIERVGCMDARFYHFLRARAESENTKYRPDMYAKREEEHAWLRELYGQWGIETPAVQEFLARRYAERLVGCIENVTNSNCTLSRAEKRAEVKRMINTPQAQTALEQARPRSIMMKMMLVPLKRGNVGMTLAEGRVISWVREHSTHLFASLKANR